MKLKILKNHFFQKLKEKVNKLFENENLTFLGKIYIMAAYILYIDTIALICFGFIKGILNFIIAFLKVETVLSFGYVMVPLLVIFIATFLAIMCLTVAEAVEYADEGESLFEKEE